MEVSEYPSRDNDGFVTSMLLAKLFIDVIIIMSVTGVNDDKFAVIKSEN